jgi:hypothetical protein
LNRFVERRWSCASRLRPSAGCTLTFVSLRDPKINPRRLMLLARPEKETSDAALAFGGLLVEAIEGLRD